MRSSTWRLEDLRNVILNLGFVGENLHTRQIFDCKKMFDQYTNASVSMTVTPPEGEPYPGTIERDGDLVIWDVRDSDLVAEGDGEIQLVFTQEPHIARSYNARTHVCRSQVPTGSIPSGLDDYITRADQLLDQVEDTFPAGGTTGQVLAKKSDTDYDTEWVDQGGGTEDYDELENRPQIGGVTLTGNKTLHDLGAASEADVEAKYTKPETGIPASDLAAGVIPDPEDLIDDDAGEGDTDKVWSADKSHALLTEIHSVSPEKFGAKGDGVTDDSEAVQAAVDAGYDVCFADNKTYYLASTVIVDHDCYLHGGRNTVIKTVTPSGGVVNTGIRASGTKRFDTTLTSDYSSTDNTGDNASNKFTLSNMTGIEIGDILVIKATDQYYAYNRQYYYLGATLEVTDIYDGHIYTNIAMPWDIENTANVTVSVYQAPCVRIQKLNFVSDWDSFTTGTYNGCMEFCYCRNPSISDCTISHMVMGLYFRYCVNAFADNIQISKSKYSNDISHDGYGVVINSSTNTYVQRIIGTCSQSCLSMSGDIPSIDTYIKKCETASEARGGGFGTHENVYNLTIEDSAFGGLNCIGRVRINRCRFFRNNRVDSQYAIAYGGLCEAKYADLVITDCDFSDLPVNIVHSGWQNGIQAKNNMIGCIKIINCKGGSLNINPSTDEYNPANIINELIIDRWMGCKEIMHPEGCATIKKMVVTDSTFTHPFFINDHYDAHGIVLDDIEQLDVSGINPLAHKILVNKQTYGETVMLPEHTKVQLSSNNANAKFIIAGRNLVSDNVDDYVVGSVTGSDGAPIVRTPATGSNVPTISMDGNGGIVYNQRSSTSKYSVYPVGMFYVKDVSKLTVTATAVNSGETDGSKLRAMIISVNCDDGTIRYRGWGSEATATAAGASVTHTKSIPANSVAMCYFYFSDPVSGAVTTIKDIAIDLESNFAPASGDPDEPYTATRRTGDGALYSVNGLNHIMSSEAQFNVSYSADYINSAGKQMNDASGVSF